MPRNLPQFTQCAAPGDAYPFDLASGATLAFGSLFFGAIAGALYWVIVEALTEASSFGCAAGVAFLMFLIFGGVGFKDWYYNSRLMCIQHDQCVSGTVLEEPTVSFDGDRKINLLLAPFDVDETEQLFVQTIDSMRSTLTNVPDLIDLQNRQVRFGFVRGSSDADQQRLYYDLIDNHMFNQPNRGFLRHYYRRDESRMGTPAFNNSDDDAAAPSNPMFRYDGPILVPFMHCEVEGNAMAKFIDNLLVGLAAALLTFVAICILCMSVGLPDILCGKLGFLAALILGFFAWLISQFVNDPHDGDSSQVDVDVEDPDFDTPPTAMRRGDVVFAFGDWIMDEEHGNYFEIHPVKAWYLLCQDGKGDPNDWVLTEEVPKSDCALDIRLMTEADFSRICRIVHAVETTDPEQTITIPIAVGLATTPPIS